MKNNFIFLAYNLTLVLSGYANGERIAFMKDIDLSKVNKKAEIVRLIIAPLRFKNADGTPVTAIAEVVSN